MEWIDINDQLPERSMKVRWKCCDGIKDIGFYFKDRDTFASVDLRTESTITHWNPFEASISGHKYNQILPSL